MIDSMESEQRKIQTLNGKDTLGMPCKVNNDCSTSSWCCSGGQCVPGTTCYQGSKMISDYCEMGFECLSRCCSGSQCGRFSLCVRPCVTNNDCSNNCCSFGYCSSPNVCQGRKSDGDTCDVDEECSSAVCSKDPSRVDEN
jgi:hypothetical protein